MDKALEVAKKKLLEVYEEIPVDIDTFIEDPHYLGGTLDRGRAIYPRWREVLREIFEDPYKYQTVILTGSIGTGKSTIGVVVGLKMLYDLLNIKDPHKFFRISATQNNIMFIFNNLTLTKSLQGMYGTMMGHCMKSPWFLSNGHIAGDTNKVYIPNKRVRFGVASEEYHITSTDCFAFFFDEANDVLHNDGNFQDSMAMKILNAANQRIRSRFRSVDRSTFFGKSIVISSKQSEMAFLEQYTQDQLAKDPEHTFVFDEPQWNVIPIDLSGVMFRVAYGNKNSKSYIMSDNDSTQATIAQGFKVLEVPLEYKKDFEDNLNRALTEVAGVSVAYIDKFFSREYVSASFDKTRHNPFSSDVLVVGLRDKQEYKEYFNPKLIPTEYQREKIYMHIDTSKSGDRTGITAVSQSRTNFEDLHHLFTVYIEAPKNDQICFKKHEDFVFYLYDNLGWDIQNVSSDGFNSVQLKQNLELHGISADYISPDRTSIPYMTLQRLIYDKHMKLLEIPLLEKELVELNMNNVTMKIDHPVTGSKDGSDSLACACQNAVIHRSADDYNITNETTVDDLTQAFIDKTQRDMNTVIGDNFSSITATQDTPLPSEIITPMSKILPTDIAKKVAKTQSGSIFLEKAQKQEDEIDMEYFRFD